MILNSTKVLKDLNIKCPPGWIASLGRDLGLPDSPANVIREYCGDIVRMQGARRCHWGATSTS